MGKSSELVGIPLIIRVCTVECSHSFLIFVSYNSELAEGFQPLFHAVWNVEESWQTWPITNLVLKWAVIKGPRLDGLYKGSYKALIRIPINQPVFHGSCQLKNPIRNHPQRLWLHISFTGTQAERHRMVPKWEEAVKVLRRVDWMDGIYRFQHGIRPFVF